jgi:hypothetical protein
MPSTDRLVRSPSAAYGLRIGMKPREIFLHRPRLAFRLCPRDLVRRLTVVAAGIGLHHAGIDSKSLTLDQPSGHAGRDDALKDMAKDVALSEPMDRFSENVE